MRAFQALYAAASALIFTSQTALAQTSTKCNPLNSQCPDDPALGGTKDIDFTKGQSSDFTASGPVTYDGQNGAVFTISKSGDSPTITSNWYLMFGRVDIVMKGAPGTGIVSSLVMESDDLDEIDWELLGGQATKIQTNYFGKGQTGTYDRGATSDDPTGDTAFNTYTVDWSAGQIVWQINGQTVRTLEPANAAGQYPQTPMQLKLGAWAGGDSSNQQGVIAWAGGATDYSQGPFKMYIQSVKAVDYSTGTSYSYSGTDGTWQKVKSNGGSVNQGTTQVDSSSSSSMSSTTTTSGQPVPFAGTHAEPSQTFTTPSVYPWVAGSQSSSGADSSTGAAHPIMPESAATATPAAQSTSSSPQASASAGSSADNAAAAVPTAAPSAPFRAGGSSDGSGSNAGNSNGYPSAAAAYAAPSSGFSTAASGNATTLSATSTPTPTSYKGAAGRTQIGLSMALVAAIGSALFAM